MILDRSALNVEERRRATASCDPSSSISTSPVCGAAQGGAAMSAGSCGVRRGTVGGGARGGRGGGGRLPLPDQ
eukprot:7211643-Prymnesium_polylepis.1